MAQWITKAFLTFFWQNMKESLHYIQFQVTVSQILIVGGSSSPLSELK